MAVDPGADPATDPTADPPNDPSGDPAGEDVPLTAAWVLDRNVSRDPIMSDAEPSIAVNDRGEVVVGWMQIDWASMTVFVFMANAPDGRTPGTTYPIRSADFGEFSLTGDITLAAGPGRLFHASWLGVKPGPLGEVTDIRYAVTSDGGATWAHSRIDPEDDHFNDRPWVTVSPSGDVYVTYTQFRYDDTLGLIIARRVGTTWTFSTIEGVIGQAGLYAGDGGSIDVLVEEPSMAMTLDLYVYHSLDGGRTFAWRTFIARTYDPSWAVLPCVPGASIERLQDGRRQVVYMRSEGGQMVLRSTLLSVGGASMADFEVARAAQLSLPWLARNRTKRTAAIWLTSGFGPLHGISSAVFVNGIPARVDPIVATASRVESVWDSCDMVGMLWPGHYFAIEADGDEFVAAWSDARTGNEEVYLGRRRAP